MKARGSLTLNCMNQNHTECYHDASSKLLNHSVPGACVKSGIIYVNSVIVIWHFSKL